MIQHNTVEFMIADGVEGNWMDSVQFHTVEHQYKNTMRIDDRLQGCKIVSQPPSIETRNNMRSIVSYTCHSPN